MRHGPEHGNLIQLMLWPPPADWEEVVITWDWILKQNCENLVNRIYDWCHNHPSTGRFHAHGWQATEGFAFRFEQPQDAIVFTLRWAHSPKC